MLFTDVYQIAEKWYTLTTGEGYGVTGSFVTPCLTTGVLIGSLLTSGLYEAVAGRWSKKHASGAMSFMNCWLISFGFMILLTMGHDCPDASWNCDERRLR